MSTKKINYLREIDLKEDIRCRGCLGPIGYCVFERNYVDKCPCINCLVKVTCCNYCDRWKRARRRIDERYDHGKL